MTVPSARRKLLALAFLSLVFVPAWAQAPEATKAPAPHPGDFERQWKEVQTKDPLVAVAYRELALAALSGGRPIVYRTICDNPVWAKTPGCRRSSGAPGGKPCPPSCKPTQNKQGIEGYMSCLDQQISCQL
jgi:hypothetical protein